MSLLGKKRKIDTCPNRLFLSYLKQWKDGAAEKESKAFHTYNKAYKSLLKYPLPLQSGKEAIILEHFGNKICAMLDSKLLEEAQKMGSTPQEHLERSRNVPVGWWQSLENEPVKKRTKSTVKTSKTSKSQIYIPAKNSGGYAILRALYKDQTNPTSHGYMKKAQLQREAQPYATKSFTISDPGSHYTAWSSMATLLNKGLVRKHGNPAKFEITEEGRKIAAMIEVGENNIQNENTPPETCERLKPSLPSSRVWNISDSDDNYLSDTTSSRTHPGKSDLSQEVFPCSSKPPDLIKDCKKIDLTLTSSDEDCNEPSQWSGANLEIVCDQKNIFSKYTTNIEGLSQDAVRSTKSDHNVIEFKLNPNEFQIVLCVDTRELAGNDSRKRELQRQLDKLEVKYIERVLQIGDFVWLAQEKHTSNGTNIAKELVLDYVVERKCMSDLSQSIRDGRFHEQKIRLKQCGLKNLIYLVEDLNQIQHQSLPEKSLHQALLNTEIVDSIFVKYSQNMATTAQYLKTMTEKLRKMYSSKTLHACDMENIRALDRKVVLKCNLLTFSDFNDQSMKSKGLSINSMFTRQLMQIHGMSCDKALSVTTIYPTPMLLRQAYLQCSNLKEKESLLSKVKFGLLNRNLGINISRCVYHLFNS